MNVFIQVVRGCPGGRLQFSGGGLKMAWLASAFSSICARCPKKVRRLDLMMDESGGWLVMRRMFGISEKCFSCEILRWCINVLVLQPWLVRSVMNVLWKQPSSMWKLL